MAKSDLDPEPILKEGSVLIFETEADKVSYYPGPGTISLSSKGCLVFIPIMYLGPSMLLEGNSYWLGPGYKTFLLSAISGLLDDPNPHAAD